MVMGNTAVVVGALGVIGRYVVDRLASLPDWHVIGLSRRKSEDRERVRYVSLDLLDPQAVEAKLSGLKDVTHVVYAAFQASSGAAANYATKLFLVERRQSSPPIAALLVVRHQWPSASRLVTDPRSRARSILATSRHVGKRPAAEARNPRKRPFQTEGAHAQGLEVHRPGAASHAGPVEQCCWSSSKSGQSRPDPQVRAGSSLLSAG
jgi:hypothetical protein